MLPSFETANSDLNAATLQTVQLFALPHGLYEC